MLGPIVGVCLERSPILIATLLGVLKAGRAYLPLDPTYPAAVLDSLIADSGVTTLVAGAAAAGLDPRLEVREVGREWVESEEVPQAARDGRDGSELAYAMYTSGSTGRAKAALIEHRSVVNLVQDQSYLDMGSHQRILQGVPVSFDVATFEIWGALLNGGRLVVPPPGRLGVDELGSVLSDHDVSTAWLTSGFFESVVDADVSVLEPVSELLSGGDVLSPDHVRVALEARPGRIVVNAYGPTETTTFATCHVMTSSRHVESPVPIGRPLRGVRIHLLGDDGSPLPDGRAGEIVIAGEGVARGYLNRPALTESQFVREPGGDTTSRAYRSGDLGRRRSDGVIEFLGRRDDQVKVRGYRVEPAEVEAALASHALVKRAIVAPRRHPRGHKQLVAFVVPADPSERPDPDALREHARQVLPPFMLPTTYRVVSHIPLTLNGKPDRERLLAGLEST
jgi:amino acid adenylation domain-containing protein